MMLAAISNALLCQLSDALSDLSSDQYTEQIPSLNKATIGQHTRHSIEFFEELLNGYETGTVNYENRKRNLLTETDKQFASALLAGICLSIENKTDKPLMLVSGCNINNEETVTVSTNFSRELLYNIEHTIHHMALMRVALEHCFNKKVDANFGIAPSTLKYRMKCVQ